MFAVLLLALSPAHAASVSLRVANPVAVELPMSVRFIGVGHRNLPADPELHPGIAAEAEHTQEVVDGDYMAADRAVQSAFELLAESGRFDVVNMGALESIDRRGKFAEVLLPDEISSLCKTNEVDALLILEGLDTDVEEEGKETVRQGNPVFEARQLIAGQALWRTYVCEGARSIDEDLIEPGQLRFEDRAYAVDPAVAWNELPEADTKMEKLGNMAGQLQGRRLAPSWANVTRTWIPGGSAGLKAASEHVKADDWSRAIETWSEEFDNGEGKVKGKAAMNLAVAAERSGDMDLARQWLELAVNDWPGGAVLKYQAALERRFKSNETVARMESKAATTERPETPVSDLPLAIPAHKKAGPPTKP